MEEEQRNDINTTQYDTSFTSTSNWTVADGRRLSDTITFESSLSLHDSDSENTASARSPLTLRPSSPDPGPCEITITFVEKQEIRQVYVRSTARVYEIYYCSDKFGGENEYLCTVRCGVATRDEEVLCASNVQQPGLTDSGGGAELDGKRSRSDSGSSMNEDGWVEVKAAESPQCDGVNSSVLGSSSSSRQEDVQDLYEATAEISDAEPCMSITLRLLSLQNKECVFVDEVFVFGDPVENDDSGKQVGQMDNPSGSSLMAMFMPTLLQLSKARNASPMRDDHSCDIREKVKSQDIVLEAAKSAKVANNIQQNVHGFADKQTVEMQEAATSSCFPVNVEMPSQVPDIQNKPDPSLSRIEEVLNQLVSRVSRVENLFSRFEECMVKPISSIEARLLKIEEKLEELSNKPQNSCLLRGTRISAPEFSSQESDNFINSGGSTVAELDDVKEQHSSIPPDDTADVETTHESHSCVIVAAPEFSNADDEFSTADGEKENDIPEAAIVSSEDKPKQGLSVDDALASALAGLLSALPEHPKYTQALSIKAPDFSGEEDSINSGKVDSADSPPLCPSVPEESESVSSSPLASTGNFSLHNEVETTCDDHLSEKLAEGVDDLCHKDEEKDDTEGSVAHAVQMVVETDFPENQSNDGWEAHEAAVVSSESSPAAKVTEEKSNKEGLLEALDYPHTSSLVNFELPILDVKFDSVGSSNSNFLLEVLLGEFSPNERNEANDPNPQATISDDGSQTAHQPPQAMESDSSSQIAEQQHNLISVDDLNPSKATTDNSFSLDMDYCNLVETPLNTDSNELQNLHSHDNNEEAGTSSLL